MKVAGFSRMVLAVGLLVVSPVASVASAQTATPTTPTCAIALGPLTTQQESVVNDYEVLVAKAQSKHTPVPPMPPEVVALIGCISPTSQTASGSNTQSTTTATAATSPSVAPSPPPASTITCPPNGLSHAQSSLINDYEILVARANSKHTTVPPIPPEVAALIACQ